MKNPITPEIIDKICALALFEVGVREATGANDGKRVEEYIALGTKAAREPGLNWCAAFVLWCFRSAGIDLPGNDWLMRRVAGIYDQARRTGAFLPAGEAPARCDLLLYLGKDAHSAAGPSGHVQLVVGVEPAGKGYALTVVGGNEGNAVKKSTVLTLNNTITAIVRPGRMFAAEAA